MKPKAAKKNEKTNVLVCDACGYENEPQRIYCHNCAVKLDRSKMPDTPSQKEDSMKEYNKRQTQKRRQRTIGKLLLNFIRTPLLAAGTACLILLFKPPANLPETPSEDELLDAPMIGVDLQGLASSPVKQRVVYSEKQVNGFLARSIRGDKDDGGMEVSLEKTMAGFKPGQVSVLMIINVYVVPITAKTTRTVSLEDGKLQSEVAGLQIGSLPIHPSVDALAGGMFNKLWEALGQERKLLERMDQVTFGEKQVEIVGGGG